MAARSLCWLRPRREARPSHSPTRSRRIASRASSPPAFQRRAAPTSSPWRTISIASIRAGCAACWRAAECISDFRYAAGRHILVSRRGLDKGPIDDALELLGLQRQIVTIVGGFATALGLARASDLIATVPERHTRTLRAGMHS